MGIIRFFPIHSFHPHQEGSQWVAKALTSETKTQIKSAHKWIEWIFCSWRLNSLGQFFKAWKLFLFFPSSDKEKKHCPEQRPMGSQLLEQHYWKCCLWKRGVCLSNRLSHVLGILHSQLICWEAQRMRQKMLGLEWAAEADRKQLSAWVLEPKAAMGMDSITLWALLLKYSTGKP